MELPRNHLKAALLRQEQQIGIWNSLPNSGVSELLAGCGFDWILIDREHTALDLPTLMAMLQAIEPYPTSAVVRPSWNDPVEIKRILDLGAQSLLIPYIQTAEEARAAVAAVAYPPSGIRGVASATRASRFGMIPDYTSRARDEICLLLQIETREGLDNLEEIAAVEGVDGIFLGPSDLAASLGMPGKTTDPTLRATIYDAIKRVRAAGKPAGILTPDPQFARAAIEAGSLFTAVDLDVSLLGRQARAIASSFKR